MSDVVQLQPKNEALDCLGVGRDGENPKAIFASFNRAPTDDELRWINDCLKRVVSLQMKR